MKPRLAGPRRRREALMEDTCSIDRPGPEDEGTYDAATLAVVQPAPASVYVGPCEVGSKQSRWPVGKRQQNHMTSQGEEALQLRRWSIRLPVSAPAVDLGDTVTITALGPQGDPTILGLVFTVIALGGGDYVTARELEVEETTYRPAWVT